MIRLMTHNVWNCDDNSPAWEKNGEDCSARARIGGLIHVYQDTLPDIIGCQEVSCLMADLLKENGKVAGSFIMPVSRFEAQRSSGPCPTSHS